MSQEKSIEPSPAATSSETTSYCWKAIIDDLNALLRLRTTPIGMKMFSTVEEMEAIPKIRRPKSIHTTDQIVAQAARLGWTVGITMKDLVGAQCGAVIGLHPRDEDWLSGSRLSRLRSRDSDNRVGALPARKDAHPHVAARAGGTRDQYACRKRPRRRRDPYRAQALATVDATAALVPPASISTRSNSGSDGNFNRDNGCLVGASDRTRIPALQLCHSAEQLHDVAR